MRFDLGTLDSGEQSLPFGLLVCLSHSLTNSGLPILPSFHLISFTLTIFFSITFLCALYFFNPLPVSLSSPPLFVSAFHCHFSVYLPFLSLFILFLFIQYLFFSLSLCIIPFIIHFCLFLFASLSVHCSFFLSFVSSFHCFFFLFFLTISFVFFATHSLFVLFIFLLPCTVTVLFCLPLLPLLFLFWLPF